LVDTNPQTLCALRQEGRDRTLTLKNPKLTKDQIKAIEKVRWDGEARAKDNSGKVAVLHEGDIVTVSGYAYRARCQPDGDYHIEIGSGPSRNSSCLIVEVPDPNEIHDAQLKKSVTQARDTLEQLDSSVFQSHIQRRPR